MILRVRCQCGTVMNADPSMVGLDLECPQCGALVTVKRKKPNPEGQGRKKTKTRREKGGSDAVAESRWKAGWKAISHPFAYVMGIPVSGILIAAALLVVLIGILTVRSLMQSHGIGVDSAESYAAFHRNIKTNGAGAAWTISTGAVSSGPIEWEGIYQNCLLDGTVTFDLPKLPQPAVLEFRTTLDGVAVWTSIPKGSKVRFRGLLRNAAVVRTYYGRSVLPEAVRVQTGCFNPEKKGFSINGSTKNVMIQPRPGRRPYSSPVSASRVDVIFYVTDVQPVEEGTSDRPEIASAFLDALKADGARIDKTGSGEVASISYRDSTFVPSRVRSRFVKELSRQMIDRETAFLTRDVYITSIARRVIKSGGTTSRGLLSDKSMQRFRWFPKLKSLAVRSFNIGDAGVATLKDCPSLQHLSLGVAMTDWVQPHFRATNR